MTRKILTKGTSFLGSGCSSQLFTFNASCSSCLILDFWPLFFFAAYHFLSVRWKKKGKSNTPNLSVPSCYGEEKEREFSWCCSQQMLLITYFLNTSLSLLLQKVAMLVSCLESFSKSLVHLLLPEGSRCWGSSCHEIEKPRSGQLWRWVMSCHTSLEHSCRLTA